MFLFGKKDYFKPREDGAEPVIAFVGKQETVSVYEVPAVVGRDRGQADVVISDTTVSRKHFYIGTYEDKLTVTDQGSTSGTVINGETLEPGVPYFLSEGDKVKIGKLNFVCHINHNRMGKKLKLPTFMEKDTSADTSEMAKSDIADASAEVNVAEVSEEEAAAAAVVAAAAREKQIDLDEPVINLMKEPELDEAAEETEEEQAASAAENTEASADGENQKGEEGQDSLDDGMEEPESATVDDIPEFGEGGLEAAGAAVPDDTIINEHARAGRIRFVYYSDHTAVETFEVKATPFVIGRARSDYAPGAAGVSRRHCFIDRTGSTYFITDLESTNGVWINGRRIKPYNRTALENGDIIGIGDRVYKVEID